MDQTCLGQREQYECQARHIRLLLLWPFERRDTIEMFTIRGALDMGVSGGLKAVIFKH